MIAHDLLIEAAQRGLLIIPDGTNLRIRPGRLCPPDFANKLRAHKPGLLALLTQRQTERTREIVRPNRPLGEPELLLLRRAGMENNPLIVTALNLFNGTIVGVSKSVQR